MTTSEITTQPHSITIPASPVDVHVAAQRAGDAAFELVLDHGGDGEQAAAAYHLAYQHLARMPGGCGPICDCQACRDEFCWGALQ